eukprot:jgi/Tetstr1/441858/TSEL_030069.t1
MQPCFPSKAEKTTSRSGKRCAKGGTAHAGGPGTRALPLAAAARRRPYSADWPSMSSGMERAGSSGGTPAGADSAPLPASSRLGADPDDAGVDSERRDIEGLLRGLNRASGSKRVAAEADSKRPPAEPKRPENCLRKLMRREVEGRRGRGSSRSNSEECFRNVQLQTEYDTYDPVVASTFRLNFLRRRSRILELVGAEDVVFALSHSGICAAFSRESNKRLCFLNVKPDEVIRSLFYNKNNASLITVSVYSSDNYSSLKCRSTHLDHIRRGAPEQGLPLFGSECLRWPGFVEFDDVNGKVLTYSAQDRTYKVYDLRTYAQLYRIQEPGIQEVKVSPGIMLLILERRGDQQALRLLSIEDGESVVDFEYKLLPGRKVDFVEQFHEKLLVKQEGECLQITDVRSGETREVPRTESMAPAAFIFLYDNSMFLTFQQRAVSVWNFAGELVTQFQEQQLWHPDARTNNIYITAQQELIISYCQDEDTLWAQRDQAFTESPSPPTNTGAISVSNILTGALLARIQPDPHNELSQAALSDVTALFYNEERSEIYTGTRGGMVHVWARGGVPLRAVPKPRGGPFARGSPVGVPAGVVVVVGAMARVQSSTPGGGVDWQFRCCDGGCGRTYRRPAPLCTHVNHGMESDDPEVAAMHLAYATTFNPSVYLRCVPRDGCPRSGHHLFHGAQAAARAAICQFCSPPSPTAPPPGVALPASAAGVRALPRQHAPAAASAAHDAALAATARWCATSDVCRKMPRTPLRGTAVGVCPAARPVLFPLLDRTLAYADRFPPTDDRSYGAEGAVCVFAGLLLRPYPSSSPAVVRKLAERRVRLWEAGDAVRAGVSVCGMQQMWRESRDGSELHNYHMEAGELPTTTSRSARRRKRRRCARARAAAAEAAEGGADAAADGVPPAVVDAHRRAAKLTAVQELRRARQAMDTADLGMVSDAAAALPALDALHPPPAATGPEYSPPEEPPDLQRAPPSWGDNADEVMRFSADALAFGQEGVSGSNTHDSAQKAPATERWATSERTAMALGSQPTQTDVEQSGAGLGEPLATIHEDEHGQEEEEEEEEEKEEEEEEGPITVGGVREWHNDYEMRRGIQQIKNKRFTKSTNTCQPCQGSSAPRTVLVDNRYYQRGANAPRPGQRGANAPRPGQRGANAPRPGQRGANAPRPGQRGANAPRAAQRGANAPRAAQRGANARRAAQRGANAPRAALAPRAAHVGDSCSPAYL